MASRVRDKQYSYVYARAHEIKKKCITIVTEIWLWAVTNYRRVRREIMIIILVTKSLIKLRFHSLSYCATPPSPYGITVKVLLEPFRREIYASVKNIIMKKKNGLRQRPSIPIHISTSCCTQSVNSKIISRTSLRICRASSM